MLIASMTDQDLLRIAFFFGVLLVCAGLELALPRARSEIPRLLRWTNNFGLVVIDTIAVRLVFPLTIAAFAEVAEARSWGLLNLFDLPVWLALVISVVILDLVIYAQHIIFHAVPAFWRLHRMHHADLEVDLSTGLRFHPGEILISTGIKFVAVLLLGPPAVAVILFEVLLNASSIFTHANIRIPPMVDRLIRLVFVTPDMHRIHHSSSQPETDSNYGFNLSWWDRLFGTYNAQPRHGFDRMEIGLRQFRSRRDLWVDRMLIQPIFRDRRRDR